MKVGDIVNNYEVLEKFKKLKTYFDLKQEREYTYAQSVVKVKCVICKSEKELPETTVARTGCKQGPCHFKHVDLTGQTIGELTIYEFVLIQGKWKWRCVCSCGKEVLIPSRHFTSGQTACKSCTVKRTSIDRILPNDGSKWNRVFRIYKSGAITRNLDFNLTFDQVKSHCQQNCYFCNSEPESDGLGLFRNGIDRLDSSRGYSSDNIVPCCKTCNTMKMDMDTDLFLEKIDKIHFHRRIDYVQ